MTPEFAELYGVVMGDGNVWTNGGTYEIAVAGDLNEKEYFYYLSELMEKTLGKQPRVFYRQGALRLVLRSRKAFEKLVFAGMLVGKNKSTKGLPEEIVCDEELFFAAVRGLFDTDGTIFYSAKPGILSYPSIEITNCNEKLVKQVCDGLAKRGFRPTLRHRLENRETYKIGLYGKKQLALWQEKIGASNPKKRKKLFLTSAPIWRNAILPGDNESQKRVRKRVLETRSD